MVSLPSIFIQIIQVVKATEPAKYTDIALEFRTCERILGSHLKRLVQRGYLEYDTGEYRVTPEGEELL